MLTIQTLISTMNQTDHSLLDKMNIQTDAIVINQCDRNEIENFEYKGHKITWMSLKERGVSLSRNTALLRATADIIIIADDDIQYKDDYPAKIRAKFDQYPQADILITDLHKENFSQTHLQEKRKFWFNVLSYGTTRLAIKNKQIKKNNIYFNLLFGPGAKYTHGEDSAFLIDCLKHHLKIWKVNTCLGNLTNNRQSTWFNGYTEKYWFDKGVLFTHMFGILGAPLGLAMLLKNRSTTKTLGLVSSIKSLLRGAYHGL